MVCTVVSMSSVALAGTLIVTVKDNESKPLAEASVSAAVGGTQAGQYTGKTDSAGVATITISNPKEISGAVRVTMDGYSPSQKEFTLGSSTDTANVAITMDPNPPLTDAEQVRKAVSALTAAMDTFAVSNATTESDVLAAAITAVNHSDIMITVKGFKLAPATAGAAGEVRASIILMLNSENSTYEMIRKIARLAPSGKYKITMKSTAGGRAYADAGTAGSGETVNVRAVADSGYAFDYWASGDVTLASKGSPSTRFTMADKDVAVTAHFRETRSGGSSGKEEKSDSSRSSSDSRDNSRRPAAAKAVTPSDASQAAEAAIDRALDQAASSGGGAHAPVSFRNVREMTPAAFKTIVSAMDAAPDGVDVTVQLDTVVDGAVTARLYVDPKAAAKLDAPIVATVDTSEKSPTNAAVSRLFDTYFANEVKVVAFGHQGAFGMAVPVAVKIDLTALDVENLMFYHYDIATNRYSLIEAPAYFIDGAGYVHFTTEKGGSLIITDSPLTAK